MRRLIKRGSPRRRPLFPERQRAARPGSMAGRAAIVAVLLLGSASTVLAEAEEIVGPVSESWSNDDATPANLPDLPTEVVPPSATHTRTPMSRRTRRGLVQAGFAVLGAGWTAAALWTIIENLNCEGEGGARTCGSRSQLLFVPVAGPLLAAGHIELCSGWTCPALWSAIQATGAVMIAAGVFGSAVGREDVHRAVPTVRLLPVLSPKVTALALNVTW